MEKIKEKLKNENNNILKREKVLDHHIECYKHLKNNTSKEVVIYNFYKISIIYVVVSFFSFLIYNYINFDSVISNIQTIFPFIHEDFIGIVMVYFIGFIYLVNNAFAGCLFTYYLNLWQDSIIVDKINSSNLDKLYLKGFSSVLFVAIFVLFFSNYIFENGYGIFLNKHIFLTFLFICPFLFFCINTFLILVFKKFNISFEKPDKYEQLIQEEITYKKNCLNNIEKIIQNHIKNTYHFDEFINFSRKEKLNYVSELLDKYSLNHALNLGFDSFEKLKSNEIKTIYNNKINNY